MASSMRRDFFSSSVARPPAPHRPPQALANDMEPGSPSILEAQATMHSLKDPSTQSEHLRVKAVCHEFLTIHCWHMQVEGSSLPDGLPHINLNSLVKILILTLQPGGRWTAMQEYLGVPPGHEATCPAGCSYDGRRAGLGGLEANAGPPPAQRAVHAQEGAAAQGALQHLRPDLPPTGLQQRFPVNSTLCHNDLACRALTHIHRD